MPRPPRDADDLLVCADVLGAFGVTAADVRRTDEGDAGSLEAALETLLSDGRDRTAVLRATIARSDRGISCSARYPRETLAAELRAAFESIGWSLALEPRESPGSGDRMAVTVTDHRGRRRETTPEYPETPLGSDNFPAILHAIDESLLAGTDASFVLLSSGVDRWRAALVDDDELERLQDRYGSRISAVEEPLLPEYGLAAYTDAEPTSEPWPGWANSRERKGSQSTLDDIGSLIDEAETDRAVGAAAATGENDATTTGGVDERSSDADTDGFELRGSPSVSRVRDGESSAESPTEATATPSSPAPTTPSSDRPTESSSSSSELGTLSGTTETKRLSNDSFGSDVAWETDDDQYRALGAALGAGGRISVDGLLEDEQFLPELPETEPDETRIEFENPFDPAAIQEATAAAEESGFVWVDSGSLETTRVSSK
ncbi:hypothetical protein D8Y22_06200 [Salinadaptatus halalkaliphilus]|uniref:Uncharacterized protein n=1 Tax=Salinadaptatus halalkaliphilus TaxID=2419781 RepID=A0A4S3TR25_9EURY|nr:hypothetical protein [Salinadaptatus halalkaliphilus]THE65755.1 hypothetical protein D8Y22_06200 [Salinadaptatus halalkaliphilus]